MELLIFMLAALGALLLLGISFPKVGVRARLREAARRMAQQPKRTETAKDFVARVDGKARENIYIKSRREARQVFEHTGQQNRYRKVLTLSLCTAAAGAVIGLFFQNILLAAVLALGFYFLPLWQSQFTLYRYNRFLNEELETALSLITTSYTRSNDILSAVKENLDHINDPVRAVFAAFCQNLEYVDANAPAQIERMKSALANKLFWQWCDSLLLCQDDHTLRGALVPIVNKFSDQKAQQQENETKMMLPLQRAIGMICITLSVIPLFAMVNADWYYNLTATPFGQLSLVATAAMVLVTINKAIRLSKPIEYDV